MSLHTVVQDRLAGRLRLNREIAPRATTGTARVPVRISSSMRVLETSLALSAIATALLIGLGR